MPGPTLVVSNPPHGTVDLPTAAPLLQLARPDLRLKQNYPVPEIWLAEDDRSTADAAAAALVAAGLHLVVVPGAALGEIPERAPVPAFGFEDRGFVLQAEEQIVLPYQAPLVAVLFSARPGDGRGPLPPPFLDLYVLCDGALRRWTFAQGDTAFWGLGNRATASFGTNVKALAEELERRFPRGRIDRRLVNMQVRRRVGAPPPGVQRRGFSYATEALNQLLERIKPGLSQIEHPELASRLAFLTLAAS